MPTHCCNYCLKPIAMAPGIKQHIAQLAHCQHQWNKELEQVRAISNINGIQHEPSRTPKHKYDESDNGEVAPVLQEGSFCMHISNNINKIPYLLSTGDWMKEFDGVATKILGTQKTLFESLVEAETVNNESMWAPFHDEEEWELASFLMKNIGQNKMDEFLKLDMVRNSSISFNSTWSFLKKVDRLHTGPAWTCKKIEVVSDVVGGDSALRHEELELWQHDPVECMEELIGNPALHDVMAYEPKCAYADEKGENHIYDEMWTGDWWVSSLVQPQVLSGANWSRRGTTKLTDVGD
ncbi:hypothetical protein F5141DRAFT_1060675 [Pisolithus sp. B1]|nr:hypothetical protein F5141DRAFT_1060675 [Pisolithus sp. B1]